MAVGGEGGELASLRWQRLKFLSAALEGVGGGAVRSRVELRIRGGRNVVGIAECAPASTGQMRCAALAMIDAICKGAGTSDSDIKFLGVRSIKAFDGQVVIVALAVRVGSGRQRLVGACLARDDLVTGAAMAVLNATNRYLGNAALAG